MKSALSITLFTCLASAVPLVVDNSGLISGYHADRVDNSVDISVDLPEEFTNRLDSLNNYAILDTPEADKVKRQAEYWPEQSDSHKVEALGG